MTTLQTKYIAVGSSSISSGHYGFYSASLFSSLAYGTISNTSGGTANQNLDSVFSGEDVHLLNHTGSSVVFRMSGTLSNSGFDTLTIGSTSFSRSNATHAQHAASYGVPAGTSWSWSTTTNPFGTTGNVSVVWASGSGGGGGGSNTPTYSLTAPTSINEGSAGTVSVSTTNVSNGTTLYWAVQPSGQFGTSTGSVSISGNAASFTLTPTADSSTEGAETATVVLYTDSARTNNVASDTFTINDTSTGGSGGSTGGGSGGSSNYGIEIQSVASSPAAVFGVNFRTSNIQKFSNSTISAGGSVSFTNIGSDATDSAKVVVVVDAGWHTSAGTFPVTRSTANGGTVTVSNNRNTTQTVKIIIVRIA